jgi:hypothetical protein
MCAHEQEGRTLHRLSYTSAHAQTHFPNFPHSRPFSPFMTVALPLSLTVMDLSDNMLTGPLPDITDNTLIWVNLTNNEITGPLPPDFGGSMNTLAVLSLAKNRLSGGGRPHARTDAPRVQGLGSKARAAGAGARARGAPGVRSPRAARSGAPRRRRQGFAWGRVPRR